MTLFEIGVGSSEGNERVGPVSFLTPMTILKTDAPFQPAATPPHSTPVHSSDRSFSTFSSLGVFMDQRRHLDSLGFLRRRDFHPTPSSGNRNEAGQAQRVLRHHYLKLKLVPRVYPRGLAAPRKRRKLLDDIGRVSRSTRSRTKSFSFSRRISNDDRDDRTISVRFSSFREHF